MRWWMLSVQVRPGGEDDLAAWVDSYAALGAELRPAADGSGEARVYFGAEQAGTAGLRDELLRAASALGGGAARIEEVADDGWAERYQRSLRPFRLGARFQVFPGDGPPSPCAGRLPIQLPPGRAFGTGDHPTTALCVGYLEDSVRPGHHVLDVGTGSGILAIAAVLLGATRVVAVEPDREAAAVAARNFRRNGVARRVELIAGTTADVAAGWFDVAAANILASTLERLLPEIACLLRPGGTAVLSGIEVGEEEGVETAGLRAGLQPVGRRAEAGWMALSVRKPG